MSDPGRNAHKSPADSAPPRHKTPLWVKGFIAAAAMLLVAFAVMHLSGGMAMNHTP